MSMPITAQTPVLPSVLGGTARPVLAQAELHAALPAAPAESIQKSVAPAFSAQAAAVAERMASLESTHQAARAIRSAERAMVDIQDALAGMKQALTQIVKQYPPYTLESQERIEYLNSISGLRKQIEALVPYLEVGSQVRDPVIFPDRPEEAFPLSAFPAPRLDLPLLGNLSSDAEVGAALGQVDRAARDVELARTRMADAVAQMTTMPMPMGLV
ncbi:MAG: hypothetical protein ACOZB0_08270 [Pseudomonadota bacterium]